MLAAVSAPPFLSPPGRPSTAATLEHVHQLADWLADPQRTRPALVVTTRNLQQHPYFPMDWAQELVGADADVVAIAQSPGGDLTKKLERRLPEGWMVFNGAARIFWPAATAGLHPRAHPLVMAERGTTASDVLRAKVERSWRQGPRGRAAAKPVRAAAQRAPVAAALAAAAAAASAGAAGSVEDTFELQVVGAWLALLPVPGARNHFDLRPYRLHRDLAEQLEQLEPARGPVAAATAAIASGYAWTRPAPTPVRVMRGGAPVLRGRDSAVAWSYPLADSGRCLFYWQPAAGPIVLARIGAPDFTDLPDATQDDDRVVTTPESARPAPAPGEPSAPNVGDAAGAAAMPRRWSVADLGVSDDQLVQALRAASKPLEATEIREATGIPADAPGHTVSKFLTSAAERGIVIRTGQRRGTRYTAPPE
jgi:hypothetical protein